MLRREIIAPFFFLALTLFACIESWRLGVGSFMAPGSGFLPFWASVVTGTLVLILLFKEKGKIIVANASPLFKGKKIKNVLFTLIALFAYPLLLDRIGFFLCTLFFIGLSIKIVGQQKWRTVFGISLSVAIITYLLFDVWLGIQIPKGKWVTQLFVFLDHLWK
jgi:hypothetical protein